MNSFKRFIVFAVFLLAALPAAAANVQYDVPAGTAQCGFYLDTATTASVVPSTQLAGSATGTVCNFNVNSVSVGTHNVVADARRVDPIWGTSVSPKSSPPFSFDKPGPTGSPPSSPRLVP